jgi:hypothetical protein
MAKPIPYDDDNQEEEKDERDTRKIAIYNDEALEKMQGWAGGQSDPLYAISSTGGWNYAWVFEDAIVNIDRDLRSVKKIGRNRYQLGQGEFTKKEIDELEYIRDALQMALDDPESELPSDETEERVVRASHHVADFNTFDDLIAHAGATNFDTDEHRVANKIYVPEGNGYRELRVWQKEGYWHAQSPEKGRLIRRLPSSAAPIINRSPKKKRFGVATEGRGVARAFTKSQHHFENGWNKLENGIRVWVSGDEPTRLNMRGNTMGREYAEHVVRSWWGSQALHFNWTDPTNADISRDYTQTVRDYAVIDRQDRTVAGPFKSYSDARAAAGGAGAVKFVPSKGRVNAYELPPGVVPKFQVGSRVVMSPDALENYGEQWQGVVFKITHVATGRADHPGFDPGAGSALYDLAINSSGEPFNNSLYDWELERAPLPIKPRGRQKPANEARQSSHHKIGLRKPRRPS